MTLSQWISFQSISCKCIHKHHNNIPSKLGDKEDRYKNPVTQGRKAAIWLKSLILLLGGDAKMVIFHSNIIDTYG